MIDQCVLREHCALILAPEVTNLFCCCPFEVKLHYVERAFPRALYYQLLVTVVCILTRMDEHECTHVQERLVCWK